MYGSIYIPAAGYNHVIQCRGYFQRYIPRYIPPIICKRPSPRRPISYLGTIFVLHCCTSCCHGHGASRQSLLWRSIQVRASATVRSDRLATARLHWAFIRVVPPPRQARCLYVPQVGPPDDGEIDGYFPVIYLHLPPIPA